MFFAEFVFTRAESVASASQKYKRYNNVGFLPYFGGGTRQERFGPAKINRYWRVSHHACFYSPAAMHADAVA